MISIAAITRSRISLSWLLGAALALLGLSVCDGEAALAQPPRRLPARLVQSDEPLPAPIRSAPRAMEEKKSYQGPPSTIDGPVFVGPQSIDGPPEIILPSEEYPLADSLPSIEGEVGPILDASEYFVPGQHLAEYRDGFFQRLALSAAWIGTGNDPGELGLTEIDSFLTVAVPFPIVEWPLMISPTFNARLFNGPQGSDVPAHVYEASVDFMWLPLVVNRWRLLMAVTPGVFSDFNNTDSESFRVNGKSLVIFDWSPGELQLVGGVLWLNRDNLPVLPAAGVIWTPRDWLRLELIFPKPKLAARLNIGQGYEDWVYLMAEYGGNSWAVERVGGEHDLLTYSDYRIIHGFERRLNGGASYRLESGVVFGREFKYRSGNGSYDPTSEFIFRGGVTF